MDRASAVDRFAARMFRFFHTSLYFLYLFQKVRPPAKTGGLILYPGEISAMIGKRRAAPETEDPS